MLQQVSKWSKAVIVALAVGTIVLTASELGASTALDCPLDGQNGLYGVCTGFEACNSICQTNHPGSVTQCGECCGCQF